MRPGEDACVRIVRNGRYRYLCSSNGCTSYAKRGGVCYKHGAKVKRKMCSHIGCNSGARGKEGVCTRHGAVVKRAMCTAEGCTKWKVKEGLCKMHYKAN